VCMFVRRDVCVCLLDVTCVYVSSTFCGCAEWSLESDAMLRSKMRGPRLKA